MTNILTFDDYWEQLRGKFPEELTSRFEEHMRILFDAGSMATLALIGKNNPSTETVLLSDSMQKQIMERDAQRRE